MKLLSGRNCGLLAPGLVLLALACSESGPTSESPLRPNFAVGDLTNSTPVAGKIKICKVGNVNGNFSLGVASNSGTTSSISPVTVAPGECKIVVEETTTPGASVTIDETSAGFVSATAQEVSGPVPFTDAVTALFVNQFHGYTVTYTNQVTTVGCTRTQGYWKNHADAWPVTSLTLGTVNYTQAQLLSILNQPVSGNGLVSLARQLIAAKLNVAAGASPAPSAIANADALIGGLVVPPVGSGFLAPSATSSLTTALDSFNNGLSGPTRCN